MHYYEFPRLGTAAYTTSFPLFLLAASGKARLTPVKSLLVLVFTQISWQYANRLYIKYLEGELRRSRARTRALEREIRRLNEVARRADTEIERIDEEIRWWSTGWHFEDEGEGEKETE